MLEQREFDSVTTAKIRKELGCNRYNPRNISETALKEIFDKGETHADVHYFDTDSVFTERSY